MQGTGQTIIATVTVIAVGGLLAAASTASMYAADTNHDGLETILLPLAFLPGTELHGAYGTIWKGEVWVRNHAAQTVDLQLLLGCAPGDLCTAPYQAGYIGRLAAPLDNVPDRGILLTPRADNAQFLSFSNRIFETTRHAQPQGIEVPVIREEQFFDGAVSLLGIPAGPGIRSALRIYEPRRIAGTSFKVEFIDSAGRILGAVSLMTTFGFNGGSDPIRPGYAAIADLTGTIGLLAGVDRFHMQITPETPGAEFWAMVSVTDNDTQQVLLITPQ